MTQTFDPHNLKVAQENGAITDLVNGDMVLDGEGERAMFCSYGNLAPIYVNLSYPGLSKIVRLPNSGLKRTR